MQLPVDSATRHAQQRSKFERVSARRLIRRFAGNETCRAAFVLIFILSVDFFPCIFGQKTLLESAQFCDSVLHSGAWAGGSQRFAEIPRTLDPAAAAWFTEPSLGITGWEYRQGSIPLWNPYQGLGRPYAADMQSQPFFPLTALFSLHITPKTYNIYLLCRLFVAGFGAYLFLRLFTEFVPALTGGITMMLAGYFLVFLSLPYLSVEILTPLVFYAGELAIRCSSRKSFWIFACMLALLQLGGMAESTLLTLSLTVLYLLFRTVLDRQLRRYFWQKITVIAGTNAAGLALSAFLVLPTIQLIHHSYSVHDPAKNAGSIFGLVHEPFTVSIFGYLMPLIFGTLFTRVFPGVWTGTGVQNFWGVTPTFLGLVAVFSIKRRKLGANNSLSHVTCFFLIVETVLIFKRFGFAPINDIGRLPLFQMVNMDKYDEPLIAFCASVLCGIGLQQIVNKGASWRAQIAALATTFGLLVLCVFASRHLLFTAISNKVLSPVFPAIALGLAIVLLFGVALLYAVCRQSDRTSTERAARRFAVAVMALVAIEVSLNYIPETYYEFGTLPEVSQNPYSGAPYIDWLKRTNSTGDRIFARGGVLYPDWAAVFQLPDIRDLDALYYWKYLPFLRNFLIMPGRLPSQDLYDRFTGENSSAYPFSTDIQKRLLQLTSTRYLLTTLPYSQPEMHLSYDREIKIYRYDAVLPRVSIYSRARIANGDAEVLDALRDPNLDIWSTVVLNAKQLSPAQAQFLGAVNAAESRKVVTGNVTRYDPLNIDIQADVPQSGILVLNDAEYPGWEATVDGNKTGMLSANYIFRGLLVSPGRHRIHFGYQSRVFRVGTLISLSTLALLVVSFTPLWGRVQRQLV